MATTTDTASPPSQTQLQAQARPEVERQRRDAEQQARRTLDRDAIAAIDETAKALKAIADGKPDEALAAIERATGKIDVLTARNPQAALLPVDVTVAIIDTAPDDIAAIRDLAIAVDAAVLDRDFPLARVALANLISEIRVRTFHLPLATYPAALREAAHRLDEKQNDQARAVLQAALNTLVVIDRITPLPLVLAQVAVDAAEDLRDRDKEQARRLLALARTQLARNMELGYMGKDEEYDALDREIRDLERQLEGTENTTSGFAKLKERLAAFFKRFSGSDKRARGGHNGNGRQDAPQGRQEAQASNPPREQAAAAAAPQP